MNILWSFLLIATVASGQQLTRVVNTKHGPVRGFEEDNVFVFKNIPYARAPSGKDRFKAPLPPPTWLYTLDAVRRNIICPQSNISDTTNVTMTEDCLVVNVHVPNTPQTNLPVVVVIHGGGFTFGNGDMRRTTNLIRNTSIISVTFNYRLGIHGFLCLGTETAPGNAAMKDQVALLRWVRDNIAAFGGNPNDVTLNGCSAGGASVDLLMLSKMAAGLFNKVIIGSASNFGGWAVAMEPLKYAQDHALILNFTGDVNDLDALGDFYTSIPYQLLYEHNYAFTYDGGVKFVPCIERDLGQEMFLDDEPMNIITRGDYAKVPMLNNFASMEGTFRLEFFQEWMDAMNKDFAPFIPLNLRFESDEQKDNVSETVRRSYFGDRPVNESTILEYIRFFGDSMFSYPVVFNTQKHIEHGHQQIYLYEYTFTSEESLIIPNTDVRGPQHCEQNIMILDGVSEATESERLRNMRAILRQIIRNFIITGEPSPPGSALPEWPAAGPGASPHMVLDDPLVLAGPMLGEKAAFWDEIYSSYYYPPSPPNSGSTLNSIFIVIVGLVFLGIYV